MRLRALLRTQPRRALLQSAQALPRYRHTLRQTRQKFSCRCAASCDYNLAQLKTGPNAVQQTAALSDHFIGLRSHHFLRSVHNSWQADCEGRSTTWLALHRDVPAHHLTEAPTYNEAKTGATVFARRGGGSLGKLLE